MSEIADTCSRCSMVPKKTALSSVPTSVHDGAFDSQNACHDDCGTNGTSRGSSRVVFHSSSLAVCNFADSLALEIRRGLSSSGA